MGDDVDGHSDDDGGGFGDDDLNDFDDDEDDDGTGCELFAGQASSAPSLSSESCCELPPAQSLSFDQIWYIWYCLFDSQITWRNIGEKSVW